MYILATILQNRRNDYNTEIIMINIAIYQRYLIIANIFANPNKFNIIGLKSFTIKRSNETTNNNNHKGRNI